MTLTTKILSVLDQALTGPNKLKSERSARLKLRNEVLALKGSDFVKQLERDAGPSHAKRDAALRQVLAEAKGLTAPEPPKNSQPTPTPQKIMTPRKDLPTVTAAAVAVAQKLQSDHARDFAKASGMTWDERQTEYLGALLGSKQEAVKALSFCHLATDPAAFRANVIRDAEERARFGDTKRMQAASKIRLAQARASVARGESVPLTLEETADLAGRIFGKVETMQALQGREPSEQLSVLAKRFAVDGLKIPTDAKFSMDSGDEHAGTLTATARTVAQRFCDNYVASLRGTVSVENLKASGAVAGREFLRAATGEDAV